MTAEDALESVKLADRDGSLTGPFRVRPTRPPMPGRKRAQMDTYRGRAVRRFGLVSQTARPINSPGLR